MEQRSLYTLNGFLVVMMLLSGGTFFKLMGLQTFLVVIVAAVGGYAAMKEPFKLQEFAKLLAILGLLTGLQLFQSVRSVDYQLFSTQYVRSLFEVLGAFFLAKRFHKREIDFVWTVNTLLHILILHALASVLAVWATGSRQVFFSSQDANAFYYGVNPLLMVRGATDTEGHIVHSNLFGIGLERAHGIFWEPSVFVNYVAVYLYINLFLSLNLRKVVLGLIAMVMAYSSTGLLLAAILVFLFTFYPGSSLSAKARLRLRRLRYLMLLAGIPAVYWVLQQNVTSFFTDSRKLGSVSQRFYDTIGAVLSIADRPWLGTGTNLDSYSSALESNENFKQLSRLTANFDLNAKSEVKFSNSMLRYFVKYGIPTGLLLFYGLWNQTMIRSKTKWVLFLVIIVGTSFSPILELSFFSTFLYSGLFFNAKESS